MVSKIILFNSPKNVGKSKAIEHLKSKGVPLISADCKDSLHDLTMRLFGVSPDRYWEVYNTRELKEIPLEEFCVYMTTSEVAELEIFIGYLPDNRATWGVKPSKWEVTLSIREAMIYVSEVLVKPRWGEDYFGKQRVRKIIETEKLFYGKTPTGRYPIFSDDSAAFVDELPPLINHMGQENILLIRVHRDGFTFDGDSRSYIPDGVINQTIDITNNGTEEEFLFNVEKLVTEWLKK